MAAAYGFLRSQERRVRALARMAVLDLAILQTLSVVPANAGTHSHRQQLFCALVVNLSFPTTMAAAYGFLRSQERRVRALARLAGNSLAKSI
jgi:hypothetical protein